MGICLLYVKPSYQNNSQSTYSKLSVRELPSKRNLEKKYLSAQGSKK